MKLNQIKQPPPEQIRNIAEQAGYQRVDLKDKTEDVKKQIRNINNDALSTVLNHFNIDHERIKVQHILQDYNIPEYEVGIVVNNKHANYHVSGFTCGMNGKDKIFDVDIVEAFKYITS